MNYFVTITVTILSIAVGLFLSPIPRKLGLYRWHAYNHKKHTNDFYVGRIPAAHEGIPWKFTFDDLKSYNLTGQTALVTGSNSGIGYEISLNLVRLGSNVHMICRNLSKCNDAAQTFREDDDYGGGTLSTWKMDTSSLSSVKEFATTFLQQQGSNSLDMLYLNAGMGKPPDNGEETVPLSEDGIELNFATNYLGHHLLYKLLKPILLQKKKKKISSSSSLTKTTTTRIVLTASGANFNTYDYGVATDLETLNGVDIKTKGIKQKNYGQSKLAQILWSKKVTRDLLGSDDYPYVFVNAGHPGVADTNIFEKSLSGKLSIRLRITRYIIRYVQKNAIWTSAEGALTLLYLGVGVDHLVQNDFRGRYFHPQSQEVTPNPLALNEKLQDDLWRFSDDLVKAFV